MGALSGALGALAFPPFYFTFVALIALVPLVLTLERLARASAGVPLRRWAGSAFGAAWATGFVYFLALLWWIVVLDAPALSAPWLRYPGTALLVAYLSLYVGLFGVAYTWIRARTQAPPELVAPALWVVAEVARGYWELGFPWGHLGYSQVDFLPAVQMASVVGIHGLTAWVVLVNALLLRLAEPGSRRPARLIVTGLVVAVPLIAGAARLSWPPAWETVRVALVQPNISNREKWEPRLRPSHFENMADLSRQGVREGAELVLWPETAAPCYLLKDATWRPWVEDLARELQTPLFVGLPDYERIGPDRVVFSNSAALFGGDGTLVDSMSKIQLVPFGERIPFSQYFDFLARVDFGEADFVPGEGPVLFSQEDALFGNLVCFEAIYPYLSRAYVGEGARLLVNITNDSWFGAGSGARQHADMAIVRCLESGCGMARCANSGISMGVDPLGRTSGVTGLFTREVSVVDVPLREGRTLFSRTGDWVTPVSALATLSLIVAGFIRRKS